MKSARLPQEIFAVHQAMHGVNVHPFGIGPTGTGVGLIGKIPVAQPQGGGPRVVNQPLGGFGFDNGEGFAVLVLGLQGH